VAVAGHSLEWGVAGECAHGWSHRPGSRCAEACCTRLLPLVEWHQSVWRPEPTLSRQRSEALPCNQGALHLLFFMQRSEAILFSPALCPKGPERERLRTGSPPVDYVARGAMHNTLPPLHLSATRALRGVGAGMKLTTLGGRSRNTRRCREVAPE
jgi:hypothetical protein